MKRFVDKFESLLFALIFIAAFAGIVYFLVSIYQLVFKGLYA